MGIKVDGVSVQPDGSVVAPGSADGGTPQGSTPAARAQNTLVAFKPDGGVGYLQINQPSEAGPSVKAGELQSQVELCKRAANLPIIGQLGATHHWLRTAHKEVGMGQNPGQLPGHGEAPPIALATQWIDHSKELDKTCVVVPNVDAACVERETPFGKATGRWIPFLNDCHTKTQEVLDTCTTKPDTGPDSMSKTGAGDSQ